MAKRPLKIYLFFCSNTLDADAARRYAKNQNDEQLKTISLPCSGKVDLLYLIKAFETGADGVVIVTCRKDACRYLEGNLRAVRRAEAVEALLEEVGLGYIKLGQSATTLSGGEAQRIKLAKELARVSKGDTVYILDEPTTGLHFADIQKLLDVLHSLADAGNTIIVIEHNLDVIKTADWIIDLGPEGGDEGGYIVAEGTPEDIAGNKNSYTGVFLSSIGVVPQ